MNEWTGFLEKWAFLCLVAWVPLKTGPETKVICFRNTGSLLGNVISGTGLRQEQQRQKERKHAELTIAWASRT